MSGGRNKNQKIKLFLFKFLCEEDSNYRDCCRDMFLVYGENILFSASACCRACSCANAFFRAGMLAVMQPCAAFAKSFVMPGIVKVIVSCQALML